VQSGFARISTGVAVLTNREGDSGEIGLGAREKWKNEGLKGWAANPVLGYGVEGFRSDFSITSHSTPIDLLYNSGLIGCTLFYGILASIAWRLLTARDAHRRNLRARVFIFLIAYSFMSLSGNIYYEFLLAIFVGVSSGMILRLEQAAAGPKHAERSAGNVGVSFSEA
jgi:O-antigen ligase